jgi:hypothetical protein
VFSMLLYRILAAKQADRYRATKDFEKRIDI